MTHTIDAETLKRVMERCESIFNIVEARFREYPDSAWLQTMYSALTEQRDDLRALSALPPERVEQQEPTPIDMILHCPVCHEQHIDEPQPERNWTNPPHRTHECQSCGSHWRPADIATNGVAKIKTKGKTA